MEDSLFELLPAAVGGDENKLRIRGRESGVDEALARGVAVTFRRFEDISAWQTARRLVAAVYGASRAGVFAQDFGLRDQIRRAAVSVMANIAEGFCHRSDKEFARFLLTAKASAIEVQSHLYAAFDQEYLAESQFHSIYTLAAACAKQLSKLISFLLRRGE